MQFFICTMVKRMFCQNCGKQLADGTLFCDGCGAKQEIAPVQENANEPAMETQVLGSDETTVLGQDFGQTTVLNQEETPAFDYNTQEQPVEQTVEGPFYDVQQQYPGNFANPEFEQPKKKKKKLWFALIPAVIALGLVAAIVLNLGAVVGFSIKTFGSDKAYLGYVEKKAFEGYADNVTDIYSAVIKGLSLDSSSEGELKLVLGDELIQLAESVLGGSMDLEWIKNIAISYGVNMDGTAEAIDLGIKLGEQEVLALNLIYDIFNGDIYMAVSSLSEKYLYQKVEGMDASAMASFYGNDKFIKALPDEETLNKLIDKYVKIALDELQNVEKSSYTLEIDDIEQDCTKIEFIITYEDVLDIALAALNELQNDEEIKTIINNVADFLEEEKIVDDASEGYKEFVDGIKTAIKSVEDLKDSMDKEDLEEEIVAVTDYVDGDHVVIGRDFSVGGTKYASYAEVRDGRDIAFELEIANTATLKGTGTEKDDILNAKLKLNVGGMYICDFEIADFDTSKIEDGAANGTIRILINKSLLSNFNLGEYAALISGFDGIEFKFSGDSDSATNEFNILYNNSTLLGMIVSGKKNEATAIEKPADSDIIDVSDGDAIQDYLESIDLNKLYDALRKAGVPDSIVTMIEAAVNSGISAPGGSDAAADFYDYY